MSDLRALIMAVPNPVVLIGSDERVRGVNDPAKRLIGTDPDGRHYITALRQPVLLDAVEETLRDGGKRIARYHSRDGARETAWDVTVHGVALSDGMTVVLTFQDMTALEAAGQMRRDFVANVSHEMRTPLTSMMGFIETLRGPARGDVAATDKFMGIMEQEAQRLHHLVEDLLSLSRVEDQERIRPTEEIALKPLMTEVLGTLEKMAEARGVRFDINLPDQEVAMLGDRAQLWQLMSNLVQNAIKYGAQGGVVSITLSAPAPQTALQQIGVQLSVRDEGEGIAAHHIARLTERFYRVDSHRSREVGGTGLGLAIVKHIINRHRGRLRIDSVLGQGTEFTVVLPLSLRDPAE